MNQENVKYFEFLTNPKDSVHLDELFSIVNHDAKTVNETAFGNFTQIVKSFIEATEVESDLIKFFFSR